MNTFLKIGLLTGLQHAYAYVQCPVECIQCTLWAIKMCTRF